jgi:hypothetical protein
MSLGETSLGETSLGEPTLSRSMYYICGKIFF